MIYHLPNQEKSLYITFENSYENLKVYFEGNLIGTVEQSSDLVNGVIFSNTPVGEIHLYFPNGRRSLEVRVDELLCTPETPPHDIEALRSIDKVFWLLAFLSAISLTLSANFIGDFSSPALVLEFSIGIIATLIYIIAAIFTRKEHAWAYLLGTIVFTLSSLTYFFTIYLVGISYIAIIGTIVRLTLLVLLFYKLPSVLKHFSSSRQTTGKHTLLDDF